MEKKLTFKQKFQVFLVFNFAYPVWAVFALKEGLVKFWNGFGEVMLDRKVAKQNAKWEMTGKYPAPNIGRGMGEDYDAYVEKHKTL